MYDRILVAVDGSPVSDRALEEAIKLAGLSGGKLRVITIVDSPLRHLPDYAVYYNPEPLREAALKAADDVLAKAREKVEALLKTQFRPEFLNRIDEIVFYKPLMKNEIDRIVDDIGIIANGELRYQGELERLHEIDEGKTLEEIFLDMTGKDLSL